MFVWAAEEYSCGKLTSMEELCTFGYVRDFFQTNGASSTSTVLMACRYDLYTSQGTMIASKSAHVQPTH